MTNRTKHYLTWLPPAGVAFFITAGAVAKFAHAPEMTERYTRMGLQHRMAFFAVAEAAFIALFLFPRTMRLGLLLLTGYFGGAMGVELLLGNLFLFPATLLAVIWIAAYAREATVFKTALRQQTSYAQQNIHP